MDKYSIKIYSRAYRDLEQIFAYIAEELLEPAIALEMIDGFIVLLRESKRFILLQ
ncbi:MAG: hypothetical protein ACFNTU_00440 [Catonella sp.]